MILHLGVIDVPEPNGNSTFEVGTILEDKYGLFSRFADHKMESIVEALENSIEGAMETVFMGGSVGNPFASAEGKIDQMFREFLDNEEMATLGVPGVPTKAALIGKSVRHKRQRGPRRPSFIDSGILQASFKSWVD